MSIAARRARRRQMFRSYSSTYQCKKCGWTGRRAELQEGRTVECPDCGSPFVEKE